jgi:hypothetical protein
MIYKQIEDSDKVFGRSLRVSTGSFNEGFQLKTMHIDEDELTTNMAKYIPSGAGVDSNQVDSDLVNLDADELETFSIGTNYDSFEDAFLLNGYSPQVTSTQNYQHGHWTEVSYGDYYANVYDEQTKIGEIENENAQTQFSISYGHKSGHGSRVGNRSSVVTQAIYNQYRNILLGPGDETFTFTSDNSALSGMDRDSFFVINFSSTALKDRLDEGNLEFTLSLNARFEYTQDDNTTFIEQTFSQTFRDDSRFETEVLSATGEKKVGKSFNIIKGTLADGSPQTIDKYATGTGDGSGEGFGLLYPDLGIIILNPHALACEFGTRIETWYDEWYATNKTDIFPAREDNVGRAIAWPGNINPNTTDIGVSDDLKLGIERNHQNFLKLFYMLKSGGDFKCRSSELVPSKHYFIRVRNTDFNYSNNPSYIIQNKEARSLATSTGMPLEYYTGRLRFDTFSNDPRSYITTIGLYNENNELLAVAKLSVPVLKSFDSETLIKVKLDF